MWSVRFQGHLSEVGYSLGFPSELAHLADECRAEQEVQDGKKNWEIINTSMGI